MLLGAGKKEISKDEVQYPPLLLVAANTVCRGGQPVHKNPFRGMGWSPPHGKLYPGLDKQKQQDRSIE